MTDDTATIAALADEFKRWQQTLHGLAETDLNAPVFEDGWSVKDMLAHLHDWQLRSIARLEAARDGTAPRYPAWPETFDPEIEEQPHDLNAWLYQQSRDRAWTEVYDSWRADFERLLALARSLPAAQLQDRKSYPWLDGYSLNDVLDGSHEHHAEHLEFMQPVLARLPAES